MYLFDSWFRTAQGIRGKVYQRFYQFGGASRPGCLSRRFETFECKIEDVTGEVDIDVGRVNVEAANLSGQVRIYNRYGTTRLYQSEFQEGDRYLLETCSGEILMFIKEELIEQVKLKLRTLCGELRYEALTDLGVLHTSNDGQVMVVGTLLKADGGEAGEVDFYLKTESGEVRLEKMK